MDLKKAIIELCKEGITKYGVSSVPRVTLREDETNSQNIFGRTAYYDPTEKHIVLYISGRHPKDILRSFCHELIHHLQNERGDLNNIDSSDPQYAQNDTHLREMEEEAYLKGNLMLRDWEDRVKNLPENKKPGLWANIHSKRERGEKPSHGNSKAFKNAKKAGQKINNGTD